MVFGSRKAPFRFLEIVSQDWEIIFQHWKVISQDWEVVSEDWKVVSQHREVIFQHWQIVSQCRKVIFRCRNVVSQDWEVFPQCLEIVPQDRKVIFQTRNMTWFDGFPGGARGLVPSQPVSRTGASWPPFGRGMILLAKRTLLVSAWLQIPCLCWRSGAVWRHEKMAAADGPGLACRVRVALGSCLVTVAHAGAAGESGTPVAARQPSPRRQRL